MPWCSKDRHEEQRALAGVSHQGTISLWVYVCVYGIEALNLMSKAKIFVLADGTHNTALACRVRVKAVVIKTQIFEVGNGFEEFDWQGAASRIPTH